MPRKMSDHEFHEYRQFQRESGALRKQGKNEAQIGAASRLIDERRSARKLRSQAGGESLLKPYSPFKACATCGNVTAAPKSGKGNMGE